jgi:hypothetical protein
MSNRTVVKTDNASLALKLELRRWVITRAGLTTLRILDLCAGEGHIWRNMRQEYEVASYTPCDRKPRMAGVIKGEAAILAGTFDLARFNVIDVDTYGEPWECWLKISSRIRQTTAVFLTHGVVAGRGGSTTSAVALRACGIPDGWSVPRKPELARFAASYCLARGCESLKINHSGRVDLPNVTYWGLVVSPKENVAAC